MEKTLSVKTGILKGNVNAGAAMPPSTATPHTVKVGLLVYAAECCTGDRMPAFQLLCPVDSSLL